MQRQIDLNRSAVEVSRLKSNGVSAPTKIRKFRSETIWSRYARVSFGAKITSR